MAHDGMGVPALTRVSGRHTPHIAIWVVAIPMLVIPVLVILARQSPIDGTGWVGTIATFGFMLGYALVGLAAPVFLGRIKQGSPQVWITGMIGLISMIIVFVSSWLPQVLNAIINLAFPKSNLFPALEGPYVWLPYLFLVWVAIGLVWYFGVRMRTPHVTTALGTRYETFEEHAASAG
jgi:amino acid transporter